MSAENIKKRKYKEENRGFQEDWTEKFLFIDNNNKSMCLICKINISNYKVSNLRRHHEGSHPNFLTQYPLNTKLRTDKIQSLQSALLNQQDILSSFSRGDASVTEASFLVAWNIARFKRPYGEGEFIKKNMEEVIKILDPGNVKLHKLISQIPMSRRTTERRICQISECVQNNLILDLTNCVAFSLALDESTDVQDVPQLAIFVRYVSSDVSVKEEMLDLVALKETTRGIDIKTALDEVMDKFVLVRNKLVSVATDGAPAMVGKNQGLIGLLKKDPNIPNFLSFHCIIHREHLIVKYFKYDNVWNIVLKIVNFIRTNGKTHYQFKNFLEEMQLNDDDEELPNDVSLWCIVRWLSAYNVLNRFVKLLNPIKIFIKEKGLAYPELENESWISDLMFLTDIMEHFQKLNLALQGHNKIITDLSQTLFSFEAKLKLFENDLHLKKFNHFQLIKSNVTEITEEKLKEYKDRLQILQTDLTRRFEDLKNFKSTLGFFINPFFVDIFDDEFSISEIILADKPSAELELLEMKEDQALQMQHKCNDLTDFWKLVPDSKYPVLKQAACRLISIFGTTYCCESLYSTMKLVKSRHRSQLTNKHLTELLRTALTNFIPNFKDLTLKLQ